jgi:hypothetical protein
MFHTKSQKKKKQTIDSAKFVSAKSFSFFVSFSGFIKALQGWSNPAIFSNQVSM